MSKQHRFIPRSDPRRVLTLYDAARCPFCARVRIVLAEKGIPYEPVEIDLGDRPAWLYAKNPSGRVPVVEEGALVLPESRVIMEYLEERFPEPSLMPADAGERARVRLALERFHDLAAPYYDLLWNRAGASEEPLRDELARLDALLSAHPYVAGESYTLADAAYVPWILRAESRLGIDIAAHGSLAAWVERLVRRPAIAAEVELLAAVH